MQSTIYADVSIRQYAAGTFGLVTRPYNQAMDTISDRLRRLMQEKGLSQYRLWKDSGVSQPTIKRILDGESKEPDKSTVSALARALGVNYGWLYDGIDGPDEDVGIRPRVTLDELSIPQYDTGGMGGNGGLVLRDQPGVIQNWSVTQEWLRANVPHCTSPTNLCIVTGFGDSMPDTYNPGDPVLVDSGIKVCDHDGVYFFRVGNEGFIKRLQRIPEVGIRVISQNKEYETWTITPNMDFEVFGKVLKAWKGKNY